MDKQAAIAAALDALDVTPKRAAPVLPQIPITSGRPTTAYSRNMRGELVECGTIYSFGKEG